MHGCSSVGKPRRGPVGKPRRRPRRGRHRGEDHSAATAAATTSKAATQRTARYNNCMVMKGQDPHFQPSGRGGSGGVVAAAMAALAVAAAGNGCAGWSMAALAGYPLT